MKLMNIDTSTLEGKIRVMQLAKEGRKLAARSRCADLTWGRCDYEPSWNWSARDYAIIEEPKEAWLVRNDTHGHFMDGWSPNKYTADARAEIFTSTHGMAYSVVRFIQVD
jgi:hypothetical protein